MIDTTDHRKNNIKNGEEKNAEHSGSSALDQVGRPNESDREGSDGQNAVKENIDHIRTDQGEFKKKIAESDKRSEQKRGPDQGKIDRGALDGIGNKPEYKHGEHKIRTCMAKIGF